MGTIQILGTGCAKCNKLEENVRDAVREAGLDYIIEKVTDIQQIVAKGIMMTPGLIINEKIISSGRLLSSKEIAGILSNYK
jgi:small redox-active disulfide protein 2